MVGYNMGMVESSFADLVWENEPLSTLELVALCKDKFNWKRTTTYTVLKRLCEGGVFKLENSTVVFYGSILFAILFGSGIAPRARLSSMPDSFRFRVSTSNFIPFKTIASYIKGFFSNTVSGYIANNNLMGNLVLFMPMGLFLPALFKSSRLKHCLIVLIGLILIEVLQLITGCGVFDIDDIILNFAGFFMVYCIMRAKFMEKIKEKLCIWI